MGKKFKSAEDCLLNETLVSSELLAQNKSEADAEQVERLTGMNHRLFELVKLKDKALSEYSERMEQKAKELQSLVKKLNQKNEDLATNMAVLKVFQLIFENEPTAILGFDLEGRLIQFNAAAVRYLGVAIHGAFLQHVSLLNIQGGRGISLEKYFNMTINQSEELEVKLSSVSDELWLTCYRLEDAEAVRGVIFRLHEVHPGR